MKSTGALLIALTALALLTETDAFAGSQLPVTANLLYWLDVSDKNSLTFDADTGELLTLNDKSGNGYHFARSLTHYSGGGGYRGPVYVSKPDSNSPPSHLPYAYFAPLTNDLVQATAVVTSPRTVFIVQKTVAFLLQLHKRGRCS